MTEALRSGNKGTENAAKTADKTAKTAITGCIGSGKSFVCERLKALGIQVFDCDASAKRLMRTSTALQEQLKQLVGESVFDGGKLQKAVLAAFLLKSEENKQAINDIVHPAVASDFEQSGLPFIESAILFDSGFDRRIKLNHVVCVSAPEAVRVSRIMQRDHLTEQQARAWIARQMPQEEVERRSDFVINNDGLANLDMQIQQMLNQFGLQSEDKRDR